MNYPLHLRFKILTLFTRIEVSDAAGQTVCFVKKKAFKLKEHIQIFQDVEMTRPLLEIRADRIIDFSAVYTFSTPDGRRIGSIARKGMRSIWRAHYLISGESTETEFEITEENPWVKVMDAFFEAIPLVGAFRGFVFNPNYLIKRPGPEGALVARVSKQPALFEGLYTLQPEAALDDAVSLRLLASVIMMVLLERYRG
jgi:uncharacterized protein YxjI